MDTAIIFMKLMKKLNYKQKYICQGGDYGSMVCHAIAQLENPNLLKGIHVNMPLSNFPPLYKGGPLIWAIGYFFPSLVFTKDDNDRFAKNGIKNDVIIKILQQTGYFHEQATKPDTIGIGLVTCPIFQMVIYIYIYTYILLLLYNNFIKFIILQAWILEKFDATNWTYNKKGIYHYNKDDLLNIVMFHWMNKAGLTSGRLYKNSFNTDRAYKTSLISVLATLNENIKIGVMDNIGEIFRVMI